MHAMLVAVSLVVAPDVLLITRRATGDVTPLSTASSHIIMKVFVALLMLMPAKNLIFALFLPQTLPLCHPGLSALPMGAKDSKKSVVQMLFGKGYQHQGQQDEIKVVDLISS